MTNHAQRFCFRMLAAYFLILASSQAGCNPPGKPVSAAESSQAGESMDFGPLYASNCAGCHGKDGAFGPAPPLNDPLFVKIVPGPDLLKAITDGRPGTPMPAFDRTKGGPLSAAQVKVLADGIKTTWGKPIDRSDLPPYSAAPGGSADRGKAVFVRACAGCHGDRGQGTTGNTPAGAVNSSAFLTLASDQVLRRYVITGRPDLKMPNYHETTGRPAVFKPLNAQDVADLTALLATWRKPTEK